MNRSKWISALFFFITLFGCSSKFINPPTQSKVDEIKMAIAKDPDYLVNTDVAKLTEEQRQALIYLSTKHFLKQGKTTAACQRLRYLFKDKTFPLRELALISSLRPCNYLTPRLILIWKTDLSSVHSAFEKVLYEESLHIAKEKQLPEWMSHFTVKLLPFLETEKEKENTLIESISLAKKMKSDTALKELEEALETGFPRYIKKPTPEQYLSVGKSFQSIRKFKTARRFYKKIINGNQFKLEEKIEAFEKLAFSYKLERSKKSYAIKMEQASQWAKGQFKKEYQTSLPKEELQKNYHELLLATARALWTINYRTKAKELLADLLELPTEGDIRGRALFVRGSISLEEKKREEAVNLFEQGLFVSNLKNETHEHLTWSLIWSHYLEKDWARALSVIQNSLTRDLDEGYKEKLQFWKAKIFKAQNKFAEANEILKELTEEDPFGYYGIAASIETGLPLKAMKIKDYSIDSSPYPILNWLVRVEEFDLAKSFMQSIEGNFKSTSEVREVLPLYHFSKWYEGGIHKYFSLPLVERQEIKDDVLPAIFPTPYKDEFLTASKRMKVPEDFIYSIARQESAFNSKVRSWADAFGLLQVTPEKARSLAKRVGVRYKGYEDLYDVEKNLLLGTLLLKNLINDFKGKFIHTVAAYNAGKSPLYRWLKVRHRDDPFEFIEAIPYKETRTYIKLVLRNLVSYRRLLNKSWKEDKEFFKRNVLGN